MTPDALDGLLDDLSETDALRMAVVYEADDYDVVYRRPDVEAAYTEEEFDEVVKNAILRGLDDVPEQSEFSRWGHLDVTVRWFHDVVIFYIPFGEWTGALVSFDRQEADDFGSLVNEILEYVESTLRTDESTDEIAENHFS